MRILIKKFDHSFKNIFLKKLKLRREKFKKTKNCSS